MRSPSYSADRASSRRPSASLSATASPPGPLEAVGLLAAEDQPPPRQPVAGAPGPSARLPSGCSVMRHHLPADEPGHGVQRRSRLLEVEAARPRAPRRPPGRPSRESCSPMVRRSARAEAGERPAHAAAAGPRTRPRRARSTHASTSPSRRGVVDEQHRVAGEEARRATRPPAARRRRARAGGPSGGRRVSESIAAGVEQDAGGAAGDAAGDVVGRGHRLERLASTRRRAPGRRAGRGPRWAPAIAVTISAAASSSRLAHAIGRPTQARTTVAPSTVRTRAVSTPRTSP